MATERSAALTIIPSHHVLTLQDREVLGPYWPDGDWLAYTDLQECVGQLHLRPASELLSTSVTITVTSEAARPAPTGDRPVVFDGTMQLFTADLILVSLADAIESVPELGLSPGLHRVFVEVSGQEEAEAADERHLDALDAALEADTDVPPTPAGPEHWWVTFIQADM
jgi:hypothetical protein